MVELALQVAAFLFLALVALVALAVIVSIVGVIIFYPFAKLCDVFESFNAAYVDSMTRARTRPTPSVAQFD
jgi:hypothetical protein